MRHCGKAIAVQDNLTRHMRTHVVLAGAVKICYSTAALLYLLAGPGSASAAEAPIYTR